MHWRQLSSTPAPAPRTTRRDLLGGIGKTAAATAAGSVLQMAILTRAKAGSDVALGTVAGVDRIAVLPGKTHLRAWAGYGDPPPPHRHGIAAKQTQGAQAPPGPPIRVTWERESGPGEVRFADKAALVTSATFTRPGTYVLRLSADNGLAQTHSRLCVVVEEAPPPRPLEPVYPSRFRIHSKFWDARVKALIVNWIPHCIEVISRSDVILGMGGIDNFVEAGTKLRGEPAKLHKGPVFSNAWVHQTIEAMSLALMLDAPGDPEIAAAQQKMRATLEDWIPKILGAQEPDGYLQTAFTLNRRGRTGVIESSKFPHWSPERRADHEGYTAGYFLEAAINHYVMTGRKDARLYDAAKRLADCWHDNLGPAPKKPWYDQCQGMEHALVRFGRFVDTVEGRGKGDKYIQTARFLLDCRYNAAVDPVRDRQEFDQSHLPVVEQYEAVGHAVRAVYLYSGMIDIAVEMNDPDYRSAVRSLWDNIVNRKYHVTGGIGSGETLEGFGADYSLPSDAYCESCASCAMIFFHWKMNLAYRDASYAGNCEETIFNGLLGSVDLDAKTFYYTNPLDGRLKRSSWHACPCCVGNIARTILMLPTWTYAQSAQDVYVNLYVGSTVTLHGIAGTDVRMVQETDYPWNGKVAIAVNPGARRRFSVHLRIPNRTTSKLYTPSPEVKGFRSLLVNGRRVKPVLQRGYAVVTREWNAGDRIELDLPLEVQRIAPTDRIAATRGKVALRLGPLVYNLEAVDQDIGKALPDPAPLKTEWRGGLLGGVLAITGKYEDGSPLLAIPNYARLNRNPELPPEAGPISGEPSHYMGPSAKFPAVGPKPEPRPPVSIVWLRRA